MADDDLDILQQLLELADEDEGIATSPARERSFQAGGTSIPPAEDYGLNENVPPNKRPRVSPSRPAAQAFKPANISSASQNNRDDHKQTPVSKAGTTEKFSGLRIKNVCFPSIVLRERLSHVPFQKLSQARSRVGATDKWATIAVLTEKDTKESATGRSYSIWRLSDLQGTNVSLFLFGKAQTGLWKESEGSVIAIFHPEARIAESKFSMSVDSEQQVVKLGTSCDMGFCRAKKKDGTDCKNAVNINTCPFCDYHVQGEYNKIRSKRTECKGSQLHRAFHKTTEASLGSRGRAKMNEGGDIIYTKPPAMKPRSQEQLQQAADAARKSIPGVSRLLASVVPGQAADPQSLPAASTTPTYGPLASLQRSSSKRHHPHKPGTFQPAAPQAQTSRHHPQQQQQQQQHGSNSRQQQHDANGSQQQQRQQQQSALARGSVSQAGRRAGVQPAQGQRHHDELPYEDGQRQQQQMLTLQEDEVDWGDGAADAAATDPALQHALAVIKAKGGLEAPDPNRPFQRRSGKSTKALSSAGASTPVAASRSPPNAPSAADPADAPGTNIARQESSSISTDNAAATDTIEQGTARQAGGNATTATTAADGFGTGIARQAGGSAVTANAAMPSSAARQDIVRQAGGSTTTGSTAAAAPAARQGTARQAGSSATTANAAGQGIARHAGSSVTTGSAASAGLGSVAGLAAPTRKADTAQNRVLAKLGLSKGGQQGNKPSRMLPSANPAPNSFAAAFGSVAAERQSTAHTDTMYKELVEDEDHDRLTRVMEDLEKKDEMQQRMEAITKLTVTAFQCKTCGTTTERRMLDCRQHDVQRVSATKRWWQCCHCNNRFTTVGMRMPKTRCPKCNDINMEFKAVSMARSVKDKSDPAFASRGDFKARGIEHAFSLNS